MRVYLEREPLLEGCRLAQRLLPDRTCDPARAHLLLQAQNTRCTLHAAGAWAGLRLTLPADVERPGVTLLPARPALDILRQADADVLLLEASVGRLRLVGETALFDLPIPDPVRLPSVAPFPDGLCWLLPAGSLQQALQQTLFATGQPDSRYALHGVLWESEPDLVRLVATDNRRLAIAEVSASSPAGPAIPTPRLLPASVLGLLARLTTLGGHDVQALFGEKQAVFQAGPATLWTRYVQGDFPNWRNALPQRVRYTVPVRVGPFLSSVRQAAAVSQRKGEVHLRFEPGRVVLEARQPDSGSSRVHQALPRSAAAVGVALGARYLVELLTALEPEETILLGVTSPNAPVIAYHRGYRHVLGPLRPAEN
jgi:DNA polymerase-3 subunit beta